MPHSAYIRRCIELAENGSGFVAPNPMVGAVIVCENEIIGEGYHHAFGEPHAEVNAINQVIERGKENLLRKSVLYVSLEPCSHTGKTPPCSDLIIRNKIPKVVIGCRDPFPEVNGRGVQKLIDAGIQVTEGILREECEAINRRFMVFHSHKRPYLLLKYAQSSNLIMSPDNPSERRISNELTDVLVHKWRSEESGIMAGRKTVESDNPRLTVRNWTGKNPVRITIDRSLQLSSNLNIFDSSAPTLIFNEIRDEKKGSIEYIKVAFTESLLNDILQVLYNKKILSLMVEGGPNLLGQFIEKGLWDEARIITSPKIFSSGIPSPSISGKIVSETDQTGDRITVLQPN